MPFYDKLLPLLGFDVRTRGSAVIEDHEKHVVWYEHPRLGFTITSPRRAFVGDTINRRKPGGLHHLAFRAASRAEVDKLHSELRQIGATIVSPPREYPEYTPPGYYALFFKDLEGSRVLWTKRKVRPASNLRADWRHRCRRAEATEEDNSVQKRVNNPSDSSILFTVL